MLISSIALSILAALSAQETAANVAKVTLYRNYRFYDNGSRAIKREKICEAKIEIQKYSSEPLSPGLSRIVCQFPTSLIYQSSHQTLESLPNAKIGIWLFTHEEDQDLFDSPVHSSQIYIGYGIEDHFDIPEITTLTREMQVEWPMKNQADLKLRLLTTEGPFYNEPNRTADGLELNVELSQASH